MKAGIYLTFVISLCLQLFYFSEYPDTVANHFGGGGMPNGWMSSTNNLVVSMAVVFFNSAIFLAVPSILKNVPVKYISFPKKTYWLAPERRENGIGKISNWMLFIGLLTNIFLISVFHLVYMANQNHPPRLNETVFMFYMSAYLVIFVVWLTALFKRFNKTR